MDEKGYGEYLQTYYCGNKEPYSESTAQERVRFCQDIEKSFPPVNLDQVISPAAREDLLDKVSHMKKSHVNRRIKALQDYYAFVDEQRYPELSRQMSNYFYRLKEDKEAEKYRFMLDELERHYECILSYGRELLGLEEKLVPQHRERIPVILSPAVKMRTYEMDNVYRSRKIAKLARERGGAITQNEVYDILQQKTIKNLVAGEFRIDHKQFGPYIVLYYNVIGGDTEEEQIAAFANVLAHEFMHYMEYRYCQSLGVTYYKNEKLSEAMADFFGVLYCLYAHSRWPEPALLKPARDRYERWEELFGSSWPYANALYFYTVAGKTMGYSKRYMDYEIHGSVEKLIHIFSICDDAQKAYDKLTK